MEDNVTELYNHNTMSVDQALEVAKRDNFSEILMIGYSDGNLCIVSSEMTNQQFVWLCEVGKRAALEDMGL